jgi:hypothetical protein
MEKNKKIEEEILKILEKNNAVLVVNLSPANLFTKIFRKFIKVNYFITVQRLNKNAIPISKSNKRVS